MSSRMTSNNSYIPSSYLCYGHAHSQTTSSIRIFPPLFHPNHTVTCLFLFTRTSPGIFTTLNRQHYNRKPRFYTIIPSRLPANLHPLLIALLGNQPSTERKRQIELRLIQSRPRRALPLILLEHHSNRGVCRRGLGAWLVATGGESRRRGFDESSSVVTVAYSVYSTVDEPGRQSVVA